jgi:hypothetical protein
MNAYGKLVARNRFRRYFPQTGMEVNNNAFSR